MISGFTKVICICKVPSNQHKKHHVAFLALVLKKKKPQFEYNRDNSEAQRLKTKDSAEIKGKAAKGHDSSFCYFLDCNLQNQFSF